MVFGKIKYFIGTLIRKSINITTRKDKSLLTFIPHAGCEIDGYNFINYKSDSALTLFRYIVEKYGDNYKYQICAGDGELDKLQEQARLLFPNIEVKIIPHPLISKRSFYICRLLSGSSYIFTSQALPLNYILKSQCVYYLGYYSLNFKNDFIEKYISIGDKYNKTYTGYFSQSLLFSQLNSIVYNSPLSKFHISGLVRNDNLLKPYNCKILDEKINNSVSYEVKNVFLYTPTHRDYEEKIDCKRGIMGFDLDKNAVEEFLEQNNAIIIIKIHSHQNLEAIEKEIPKGIILHKSSHDFGLNELLQRANYLITDYTSAYYDFLLLDRPVLFNFYDYKKYEESRGFSFDPINSILAGEEFSNQETMLEKMKIVMSEDKFKEKRRFVRDLVYKYIDTKAAERVYNIVFNSTNN